MAPWPEVENAQPNPGKYIEGITSQQPPTDGKGKETNKSKCCSSSPQGPPGGTPRDTGLIPHFSWPLLFVWPDVAGTSETKIELLPSHSTATLIEEPTDTEDPWDLPECQHKGIKWTGKVRSARERAHLHYSITSLSTVLMPFKQRARPGLSPDSLGGLE